jgi:hypothetical protein
MKDVSPDVEPAWATKEMGSQDKEGGQPDRKKGDSRRQDPDSG